MGDCPAGPSSPLRPHTRIISVLFYGFSGALPGDRAFADDKAIVGGLARLKVVR